MGSLQVHLPHGTKLIVPHGHWIDFVVTCQGLRIAIGHTGPKTSQNDVKRLGVFEVSRQTMWIYPYLFHEKEWIWMNCICQTLQFLPANVGVSQKGSFALNLWWFGWRTVETMGWNCVAHFEITWDIKSMNGDEWHILHYTLYIHYIYTLYIYIIYTWYIHIIYIHIIYTHYTYTWCIHIIYTILYTRYYIWYYIYTNVYYIYICIYIYMYIIMML